MVKEINEEEFKNEVLANEGVCVVDFFAEWCPPCKMLSPEFEKVSEGYENIKFFKVDTDKNMELATKYKIELVPTVIFFKNGQEVKRESGYITKEELKQMIEGL